ncbi:MAG: DUF2683 family protein [Paludibacteraceae bacterium]
MATAVRQNSKQAFMLYIDSNDKRATKLIEALKVMDFVVIEKSPYNPDFVAKIKRSEKSKKHFVEVANLWD